MLPGQALGIKGEVVLNALLRQDGGAGSHTAHHRDLIGVGVLLLRHRPAGAGQGDGPGLALCLDDDASLLQPLQMEMDGGGGLETHSRADLTDRRGIAMFRGKGLDVVVDLLLLRSEFLHGLTPFHRWASSVHLIKA